LHYNPPMFHCFIDESCFIAPEQIVLKDSHFHHLIRVARVKKGEKITCHFDGKNYFGEITQIDKESAQMKVLKVEPNPEILPLRVTLAQGLTKADKLEDIIQKCTEAGIHHIIPVEMARSIVKASDADKKHDRWQKIALSASEQCGRSTLAQVEKPVKVNALNYAAYDLIILCDENESNVTIKSVLETALSAKSVKSLLYIVGPEGGLTPEEVTFLKSKGAVSVTFGPRVYRAETAPLIFMAMLNYHYLWN
jgi:16S rRNA (uracil1498-N3)-methyltransferase